MSTRMDREKTGIAEGQPESRTMTFVMSDESPDRQGDVVRAAGWKLDAFMQNPVFLSMHDSGRYPIGRWDKVWVEGDKLKGVARFADKGTSPEADLAYALYKQGIMNAVSVKFFGDEYEPNEHGGLTFSSQELLECSAVPVPANANALAIARAYEPKVRDLFIKVALDGADGAGAPTDPEEPDEAPDISGETLAAVIANLS